MSPSTHDLSLFYPVFHILLPRGFRKSTTVTVPSSHTALLRESIGHALESSHPTSRVVVLNVQDAPLHNQDQDQDQDRDQGRDRDQDREQGRGGVNVVFLLISNELVSLLRSNSMRMCRFYIKHENTHTMEVRTTPPLDDELARTDSEGAPVPAASDVVRLY